MTDAPVTGASAERLILLLVGAVGAGKGTQASILSRELGLVHLASGNLFRAALAAGTPLGEAAREYMEAGELVPDELTIAMFMEELARSEADAGAILDGFPRTVGQAKALDDTLAGAGERIRRVLYIEVPTDVLVRRVAGRWICPQCSTPYHVDRDPPRVPGLCDRDGTPLRQRDDDRPEVVRARLDKQVPPMLAVVEHYERAQIVERLDGTRPIEAVTQAILASIGVPAAT
ncbi:MAG: nucleoside monophosphate kinase [Chloroflexi bacterium]|nr:nucleoside monophosphate kinase [Chloroflexota bacterium]